MTNQKLDGLLAEGVGTSLTGGLARRSRYKIQRVNSAPENTVLDPPSKFVIGVCAMDKKAGSKPMKEILQRITSFNEFEVVVFGDQVILEAPVEEWPRCDCLLSWHSDGFPLHKAQEYVALRHPFCVNDSMQQEQLLDRRRVYQTLKANGIPVPQHIVVTREPPPPGTPLDVDGNGLPVLPNPPGFIEEHDWVEMDGVRISKPFVEKPVSGEDHRVWIYYHSSHGGGVKRLFRKVDDKSADYDPNHPGNVRRDGSYIYEEFLTTGGTDVKVYTVGPRYAHAEARKSPVVDGRVQRSLDGKEMRYPVLLSPQEKEISRMVCLAFSQKVCGFDLLRSEKGKSYVCDVNGWSFVKNSTKYLDDAAGILRSMILMALAPQRVMNMPMLVPAPIPTLKEEDEDQLSKQSFIENTRMKAVASLEDITMGLQDDPYNANEELRCVLAVVRHGDRTPKQKIKIKITQPALLALFDKYRNTKGDQAKLKNPMQLQEFLCVVRNLLSSIDKALFTLSHGITVEGQEQVEIDPAVANELGKIKLERDSLEEFQQQLTIVRTVLEQDGGHFSGVNRKVQLKPLRWRFSETPSQRLTPPPDIPWGGGIADKPTGPPSPQRTGPVNIASSGSGGLGNSLSRPGSTAPPQPQLEEALLVVKWGGVLTHAGRHQAERLGQHFRATMYPKHGPAGGGLLRLHSTYRHDLKIYSSDEGRVQVSAAAFAKGLLDLEGNSLTPILVSLVNKDASMLEAFGKGASEDTQACKNIIQAQLTHDPAKGPPPPISTTLPSEHIGVTTASPSPPFSPRPPQPHPARKPPAGPQPGAPVQPHPLSVGTSAALPAPAGSGTTTAAASPVPALGAGGVMTSVLTAAGVTTTLADWDASNAASPARGPSPSPLLPVEPLPASSEVADEVERKASLQKHMDLSRSTPAILPPSAAPAPDQPLQPQSISTGGAAPLTTGFSRLSIAPPFGHCGSLRRTASLAGGDRSGGGAVDSGALASAGPSLDHMPHLQPFVLKMDKLMHMPDEPLALLRSLLRMMKDLVDQLTVMCQEDERRQAAGESPTLKPYNSQSQAPEEWELCPYNPCGGERMVLLLDRWRKLYDALYSEKKGQFDISKIPDIYDSVKHDAIHNSHLGLSLEDIYYASKSLADVVIPQEYGLEPHSKLSIGSKIAKELVGKLLADMSSMKMESESTAIEGDSTVVGSGEEIYGADTMATEFGRNCLEDDRLRNRHGRLSSVTAQMSMNHRVSRIEGEEELGDDDVGDEDGLAGDDMEDSARHRLCPTYASDINSPLRHVRTRIYYTSESHIHSLVNVLRFCHLRDGVTGAPLVNDQVQVMLDSTPEHDYLTHIVFRMFENMSVPVGDPARFRVEVLFSPGAARNPLTQTPSDHTLPVVPMEHLNRGVAYTFRDVEQLLAPFAVARKVQASYALSVALKAPSNPLSRHDSALPNLMMPATNGQPLPPLPQTPSVSSASGASPTPSRATMSHISSGRRGGWSDISGMSLHDEKCDQACMMAMQEVDGRAGGAGGSGMGGLTGQISRMTSVPSRRSLASGSSTTTGLQSTIVLESEEGA